MATSMEVIRNFMSILDATNLRGRAALDEAARQMTGLSSWQAVIDYMYNDCKSYGKERALDFLREKCGIILDNEDTGAISGSDAGSGPVKTALSVVPENDNNWQLPASGSTTYEEFGLTVNWPNLSSLPESQLRIISGLYTWWIPESLRLIRDSYGLTFNESGTTVNTISSINFVNLADDTLALVNHQYYTDDGKATALSLTINMRYYANLGADVNGTAKNTHLDRVIAHEMTHAAMAANIDFFHAMPISVKEGAAELVHGIDDERTLAIKQLARNADNLKTVLSSDSNYGEHSYAGGYMLLRYLAHQLSGGSAAPASTPAPEPASTPTDTTETKPNVTKLTAKSPGSFWLSGYDPLTGEKDTAYPNCKELDGSEVTGEVILGGNGQDNLIKGGKGSSSLWGGGASNDTLQGGSGRDMIWYGAGDGHDVASNFTSGTGGSSDVLNFYSGSLSGITRSGNTLHLSMADGGSLTVNTTAGSDSAVLYSTDGAAHLYGAKIGESAKANNLYYQNDLAFFQGGSGRDTLTASGSDSKSIWLDGSQGQSFVSIELLDGSKSSGSDQLAGGWGEETIVGGGGSASLWGGAGSASDTLRSGSGSNVLFYGYGEGNDVMQNTSSGDRVMLYNMGLEHLTGAQVSKDIISITTTAGHTLTVSGQAGVFTLGDGSSWKPDRQQGSWSAV